MMMFVDKHPNFRPWKGGLLPVLRNLPTCLAPRHRAAEDQLVLVEERVARLRAVAEHDGALGPVLSHHREALLTRHRNVHVIRIFSTSLYVLVDV